MPRWRKGEETIERLLETGHLERAPVDNDAPAALIAAAQRHADSARSILAGDPEGAYALAYDAARKSSMALLAHQGLRPTRTGGHIVVVEAVRSQFPDVPGLRSLDMLRRRRNQAEYPDPARYDWITDTEVVEAVSTAQEAIDSAGRLLALPQLGVF